MNQTQPPPPDPNSPLGSAHANAAAKARLTEEQKKKNHIESEKKRREAIRQGFDRLSTLVPGMQGQARSEAIVLAATVEHMRAMVAQREQIAAAATAKGWTPEQINRYYQQAEAEARQLENAPLQVNSAGVPIAMPQVTLQQVPVQGQTQIPTVSYAQTTPATPVPASAVGNGGVVSVPETGMDGKRSHSDSPPDANAQDD